MNQLGIPATSGGLAPSHRLNVWLYSSPIMCLACPVTDIEKCDISYSNKILYHSIKAVGNNYGSAQQTNSTRLTTHGHSKQKLATHTKLLYIGFSTIS